MAVVMYLPHTRVPAQDPVVFGATQQQFRVSLAPRDRENSPKIDEKETGHISYPVHSPTLSPSKHHAPALKLRNASAHFYPQPDSSIKQSRPSEKNHSSPKSSIPDVRLLKMKILEKATQQAGPTLCALPAGSKEK